MKLMTIGEIIFNTVKFVPYHPMFSNIHIDTFLKESMEYWWEVNNVF
jgi:hypothetical protein